MEIIWTKYSLETIKSFYSYTIRKLIYGQHKIFYFISENSEIYIVAIIHFKQNTDSILNSILKSFNSSEFQ